MFSGVKAEPDLTAELNIATPRLTTTLLGPQITDLSCLPSACLINTDVRSIVHERSLPTFHLV
jgi:hypothetical protein